MPIKHPVKQTPMQVREVAKVVAQCAADLEAVAAAMEAENFAELEIPNFGNLQKAMAFCSGYAKGAKDVSVEAKKARGDFGVFLPRKVKAARVAKEVIRREKERKK